MKQVMLNNGKEMPTLGIGVFTFTPQEAEEAVCNALKNGYRSIDTANMYMNEKAVGRGMKKSGVTREEIFLTTKLWPTEYDKVSSAIDSTLKRLDTDYIDMLYLHQALADYKGAYKEIEKAVKEGKVNGIGLSNFNEEQIQEILDICEIKPSLVQVEAHPYYQQEKLREFLKPHGIIIEAWFPLGHGDKNLIEENLFTELGKKYNKSNAQIILRWHIQVGNIVIPGARSEEHIKQNIDLYDFELTDEEMAEIRKLDKNTRYYNATPEMHKQYLEMHLDYDSQE